MPLVSFICCQLLNLGCCCSLIVSIFRNGLFTFTVPMAVRLLAPFCLSSACSAIFDLESEATSNVVTVYVWLYSTLFMILISSAEFVAEVKVIANKTKHGLWGFIARNVKEDGVSKRVVRFLDTLGTLTALWALVIAVASIFMDHYEVAFVPQGFAEDVARVLKGFQDAVEPLKYTLTNIIETLDREFTCKDVYSAAGTGVAVSLFAGFFPGASSVSQLGSKSAYYGVRTAHSMTTIATQLRKSAFLMWKIARVALIFSKVTALNFKKIVIGSNFLSVAKLLPFFPPVFLGVYALFPAFWPARIILFSKTQRRRLLRRLIWRWFLGGLLLSLAISVNTRIVDEMVRLVHEEIPLIGLSIERKLGWKLSALAFALSFVSVASFMASLIILRIQTRKNHENITNAEKEWEEQLVNRELMVIRTALGRKLETRTRIKYKKERIGPWNWLLPILLCGVACYFGYLANVHPKFRFNLEPKGTLGRMIENVQRRLDIFDTNKDDVTNSTASECAPYPSFSDMLSDHGYADILMGPVNRFFNATEEALSPLRDLISGMRKQLLLDVQEDLFGDTLDNIWTENNLQYLGMIFMAPRAICLFILAFGCLASGIFVCQMQICESIEPKRLVNAYGIVAVFSVFYVLGTQFAFYNAISAFGIPFFHLNLQFGLGFYYDLVADFILVSIYIGMKNEFFFAIPKKKVVVAYKVPGVSSGGAYIPGQII